MGVDFPVGLKTGRFVANCHHSVVGDEQVFDGVDLVGGVDQPTAADGEAHQAILP
jgi:hypothetical protein